eukprot:scaffold11036_cov120-Isochrysis_galbana.AAC.5
MRDRPQAKAGMAGLQAIHARTRTQTATTVASTASAPACLLLAPRPGALPIKITVSAGSPEPVGPEPVLHHYLPASVRAWPQLGSIGSG